MRILTLILMLGGMATMTAQAELRVNDELLLGEAQAASFDGIEFPKANILLKRGAVADFQGLEGVKVVVAEIREADGKAVLRRADGKNFFRFYPEVVANYEEAFEKGALLRL